MKNWGFQEEAMQSAVQSTRQAETINGLDQCFETRPDPAGSTWENQTREQKRAGLAIAHGLDESIFTRARAGRPGTRGVGSSGLGDSNLNMEERRRRVTSRSTTERMELSSVSSPMRELRWLDSAPAAPLSP